MSDTISARCPDCGNDSFAIPDHDDEQVVCTGCGSEMGTKRQCLNDLDQAAQKLGDDLLGGFGNNSRGGFKTR
ncbi:hypothetical protein PRZ61_10715 [Halomonas pacifica]|uniref:TFIIB-type domain-containing protein n=1 Tax=Bisbaumannia pacifica TaxID=77098 RepID=A0A510XCM3_9GAMM|nr:hypothetical protein [Halomonas pacifica]MDC8803907.1 hypothetical protein [Halomonas pacifica]GEK49176.1 hypothetical protein HPA02_34590 [Halomonas pacifica]